MRFVIWGAPCSGKTTYVREHAVAGDVICDYDALYQAISGLKSKERIDGWIKNFMDGLINKFYDLVDFYPQLDAWIITASRDRKKVESLVNRFEAELVELEVSREEAHKRCDEDQRPAEWHEFIDRWFDATGKGYDVMETKSFNTELEFKEDADQTGQFKAVFSWFDVIDKHGDVTLPGAFEDGAKVKIASWGHDWGSLPVGRGEIHQDDTKAWVDGKFFLDTEAGLETYKTVKNLGDLQEWSYGFETIESSDDTKEGQKVRVLKKLKTFEVSPVFIGAGNDTQTLTIKMAVEMADQITESEDKTESETVESGNESRVDPADMKLLIEIIALEAKNE